MDFHKAMTGMLDALPRAMLRPAELEKILRESDHFDNFEFLITVQSWFEDGPDVAKAIASARSGNRAKLASYLLQSVMTRHRHKWAELFLRTSMWMRESRAQEESCWRELALIAKAVASGRDLSEIGLMRDIAERTVVVHADYA